MLIYIYCIYIIDRRLDGKVKNAKKEHLRVLLPAEEKEIVQFVEKQEQSSSRSTKETSFRVNS